MKMKLTLAIGVAVIASPTAYAQMCATDTTHKKPDPFAFADFTWLNGNPRTKDSPLKTAYFTGEFRADANFVADFNHPSDHSLVGTSELGRTSELQVQQLGIGGDFLLRRRGRPPHDSRLGIRRSQADAAVK